jgi:glycosyltransferase involved in cell wall biosynthesis
MSHPALVEELAGAVAVVNTSAFEGMPNTFLEAWGLGVPALTLSFDPDNLIRDKGLGIAAGADFDAFVAGARELWNGRADRSELSARTVGYIREFHSVEVVGSQWEDLLGKLGAARDKAVNQALPFRSGVETR